MKVIIINKDKNFIFAIFKVVALGFVSFNNSYKLCILSFLSNINKNHFFRKIDYQKSLTKIRFI